MRKVKKEGKWPNKASLRKVGVFQRELVKRGDRICKARQKSGKWISVFLMKANGKIWVEGLGKSELVRINISSTE